MWHTRKSTASNFFYALVLTMLLDGVYKAITDVTTADYCQNTFFLLPVLNVQHSSFTAGAIKYF